MVYGFSILTFQWLSVAERCQLYWFCADIGSLALKIAYDHSSMMQKSLVDPPLACPIPAH